MKIVLAYSGGLDTSIIIPWLRERYTDSQIICVCINAGQEGDLEPLRQRAAQSGATRLYIIDARQVFVERYLFPLLRSGALYERQYYLGTAIARPLQSSQQVRVAQMEHADALAHGCTGKGNDQFRFELSYRALAPSLKIIAPWRMWDIASREDALRYARAHNIPLDGISEENIYSRDANLWHISHEGGALEEITKPPPDGVYLRTVDPKRAPDRESTVAIGFEKGAPVSINGTALQPMELLIKANEIAAQHGIGRSDIVETRIVGMKSRGLYETPGGTLLYHALRELEAITIDKELRALKQYLSDRYADLVYNGKWFSEERTAIDGFMERAAANVSGEIAMTLYKGSVTPLTRRARRGLYDRDVASFGAGGYEHAQAEGFVNLYGLPTVFAAARRKTAPDYDPCPIEKYELD